MPLNLTTDPQPPADAPVFSRRDIVDFQPPGSPRSYRLAPLTFRERQAFRADLQRACGILPSREQLLDTLRRLLREASPGNLAELLSAIDAAEEDTEANDRDAQGRLADIEVAMATQPAYAALLEARQRWRSMMPFVAARHALRGWSGPRLPEWATVGGLIDEALLNDLPDDEITAVGLRAAALMQLAGDAVGNSEPPSPSPATRTSAPAA